ncbi:MAG: response regulator [Burkholderiales bacterium]
MSQLHAALRLSCCHRVMKNALVLTDLSMPHVSGIDLARRMLAIRADTAIVLVTGFSANLTPERARELGFRELVHKPTTLSSLAEAVHRALGVNDDL